MKTPLYTIVYIPLFPVAKRGRPLDRLPRVLRGQVRRAQLRRHHPAENSGSGSYFLGVGAIWSKFYSDDFFQIVERQCYILYG
jgi:hypothetical protein